MCLCVCVFGPDALSVCSLLTWCMSSLLSVNTLSETILCVCAEPDFVGSALVRESSGSKEGDDDKIYFFFSERALELDCDTELTVARVARVCKVPLEFVIRTDL